MADILPFKKKNPSEKAKGVTLCRSGFHKWIIESEKRFDVKAGKLVTAYKCSRCGATKTKAL
jgi:hypothetical protein